MHALDRQVPYVTTAPPGRIGAASWEDLRLSAGDGALLLPARPTGHLRRRPRRVVVDDAAVRDPLVADRLAELAYAGVSVRRASEHYERSQRRVLLDGLHEDWFLFHRPLRARRAYAAVKRATDVAVSLVGSAVVLLVVAPLVWVALRLDDGGPVFYRQERVGRGGRPFEIWKFRTMRTDAETSGPQWARPGDPRVTRSGAVLRRTRLDELPQLFNVLLGHMSLVGPRPERPFFVQTLSRAIPYYERRHLMRPGITGWATVRFGYGDSVGDKWHSHEYDLYYLKNRSLLLDLEILLRTVLVVLLRRGQ